MHLDRVPEALKYADKLVLVEDWNIEGLYLRAIIHAVAKQEEEAVKAIREVLEAAPFYVYDLETDASFAELLKRSDVKAVILKVKKQIE